MKKKEQREKRKKMISQTAKEEGRGSRI